MVLSVLEGIQPSAKENDSFWGNKILGKKKANPIAAGWLFSSKGIGLVQTSAKSLDY
jgi:hypothetical protein